LWRFADPLFQDCEVRDDFSFIQNERRLVGDWVRLGEQNPHSIFGYHHTPPS
jgi:hypothetical protein